jgi:hypothetical protein
MSNERLGIVEDAQLRGERYAKFFYRAPELREPTGADAARLEKLERENTDLRARVVELQEANERLRASSRVTFIPPSLAKPEAVAVVFCREMKAAGYEIEGVPYAIEHLVTPRRSQLLARPRHLFMWVARRACSGYSLPKIGKFLGGRDHTTVMHGCHKATKVMREDPTLRAVARITLATFGIELPE